MDTRTTSMGSANTKVTIESIGGKAAVWVDLPGWVGLSLPWPLSVNHYWSHVRGRAFISKRGEEYRATVCAIVAARKLKTMTGPLTMIILATPPDKRRRDLDNLLKVPLDSLQKANLYPDDYQIADLHITREEANKAKAGLRIWVKEGK